jgi:Uncharacterized protein conserved in bacteria
MVNSQGHLLKGILIGDYTKPPYHPLQDIDKEIGCILAEEAELQFTEDYEAFKIGKLNQFDLCISYTDCWDQKLTLEQVAGLLTFVSGGGGLLVIHNGISLQGNYELAQLIGARFTGHPPMQKLLFTNSAPDHAITAGVASFEMEEEPYHFDFDNFSEKEVLLEYRFENTALPAAWAHRYGLGKVVFLMPGHCLATFKDPAFGLIIRQSVRWLST